MNIFGWLMLVLTWGIIMLLCVYCFKRIFEEERKPIAQSPKLKGRKKR